MTNPFITTGYVGPELFCDRENETKSITSFLENGMNECIFSLRRMGKSSLIHHVFYYLDNLDWIYVYLDIYSCQNEHDFVEKLAQAVSLLKVFKRSKSRLFKLLGSLKATLSLDELTGRPQVSLGISDSQQTFFGIREILNFLESLRKPVVIAIDEFQQILEFPEKGFEAHLRELCQEFNKIRFIFSGSRKHLMQSLFIDPSRPFFQSSGIMELGEIDGTVYQKFIVEQFQDGGKSIDPDLTNLILTQTLAHTYYTQNLCNRVFGISKKIVKKTDLKSAWLEILEMYDNSLFKTRNNLTEYQQKVLGAVASEETIRSYQNSDFISRYQLKSPAAAKRAVESLLEKQYLVKLNDGTIRLEDVFLMRKLGTLYQKTF